MGEAALLLSLGYWRVLLDKGLGKAERRPEGAGPDQRRPNHSDASGVLVLFLWPIS